LADVADVRGHDDHRLARQTLRTDVHPALVAGGPRELELEARATAHAVHGRESVGHLVAVSPRRVAVACKRTTAVLARVPLTTHADALVALIARRHGTAVLRPAAGRFAAVPIPRGESLRSAVDRRIGIVVTEVGTEITRVAAFVAAAHASSTRPVAITREPIGIAFAPVRPRRAGLDRIAVGGRDVRADVLRFGGRRR